MVKDVRRCSAKPPGRIQSPQKSIFIWIMSPLWLKKTSVAATDSEKYQNSAQKNS